MILIGNFLYKNHYLPIELFAFKFCNIILIDSGDAFLDLPLYWSAFLIMAGIESPLTKISVYALQCILGLVAPLPRESGAFGDTFDI